MLSEEGRKVKQGLENLNQLKRKLRNLQEELKSWQSLDGAVKSASFEQHVSGGEVVPFAERRLIKIEELKELISKCIDDAIEKEDQFLREIENLDALSQNLLMERYMTGKSLKRIIREFNYSERQIYRLYDNAFENIGKNERWQ
ncbi:MAG: hypothetical protein IJX25_00210 [Clostridia bacterium]|nr:hypothetical protein [Clostridia bacterium]